jgi:hypothetical protein
MQPFHDLVKKIAETRVYDLGAGLGIHGARRNPSARGSEGGVRACNTTAYTVFNLVEIVWLVNTHVKSLLYKRCIALHRSDAIFDRLPGGCRAGPSSVTIHVSSSFPCSLI